MIGNIQAVERSDTARSLSKRQDSFVRHGIWRNLILADRAAVMFSFLLSVSYGLRLNYYFFYYKIILIFHFPLKQKDLIINIDICACLKNQTAKLKLITKGKKKNEFISFSLWFICWLDGLLREHTPSMVSSHLFIKYLFIPSSQLRYSTIYCYHYYSCLTFEMIYLSISSNLYIFYTVPHQLSFGPKSILDPFVTHCEIDTLTRAILLAKPTHAIYFFTYIQSNHDRKTREYLSNQISKLAHESQRINPIVCACDSPDTDFISTLFSRHHSYLTYSVFVFLNETIIYDGFHWRISLRASPKHTHTRHTQRHKNTSFINQT